MFRHEKQRKKKSRKVDFLVKQRQKSQNCHFFQKILESGGRPEKVGGAGVGVGNDQSGGGGALVKVGGIRSPPPH